MKISQPNAIAVDEDSKSLHQRRPELAELAARVAEGKGDLEARRRLADEYLSERLYSHAYNLYREIQTEAPNDAGVELALARISDNWSDYPLALQYATTAVRIEPDSAQGWDVLGRIHLHAGELDSARSAWTTALQINGQDASVLANVGYVFLLERNWQQARVFLERALGRDGSLAEARNNLGIVLANAGDDEGALQQFVALTRPAVAYNNLGVIKLDQALWAEAANGFQQALTYEPDYLTAQDNLTEVQAHLPRPTIVDLPPFDASPAQAQSAAQNSEAAAPTGSAGPEDRAPKPAVVTFSGELPPAPVSNTVQRYDAGSETPKPEPQHKPELQASTVGFEARPSSVIRYCVLAILGMAVGYGVGNSVVGMVVAAERAKVNSTVGAVCDRPRS